MDRKKINKTNNFFLKLIFKLLLVKEEKYTYKTIIPLIIVIVKSKKKRLLFLKFLLVKSSKLIKILNIRGDSPKKKKMIT